MFACILDQGQVIKYFCRISLVMYLVYYNYSSAGPECQANDLHVISKLFYSHAGDEDFRLTLYHMTKV